MKRNIPGTWTPLRIACLYAFFGVFWILFSDSILLSLAPDPELLSRLQTYKGWFFILVTALLLFGLMNTMVARRNMALHDLQESEQYNRLLFELSPMGLALCRMDGALVDINPAYARIIGRSVEETLQLSYWDITPSKYADLEKEQLKSIEKTGRYGPYKKEYIHREGYFVPVRLQGLLIEKDGQKFIWSSVEDISASKEAEKSLQRNEQMLRLFVEHSPAAIAMFDRDMKYIVASIRFRTDYNLGDKDIVGRSHYEVFPEISERWKEIHNRCLAGAVEKSDEDPFSRADGSMDWVRWEVRPWYEPEGGIGGVILFSEVITERKQAEAALRLSEEKFAKSFRNSPDAIALTSLPDGEFVEVNESFLQISGYSLDEIIGRTTVDLHLWANSADRERYLELMQKTGRVSGMEAGFQKKSGEVMSGLVSGEFIEVQNSTYILTVILDITERKTMEVELKQHRKGLEKLVQERTTALADSQQALMNIVEDLNQKTEELERVNAKLKELDRLKSMFIASMSHELRTPLNSIIGFSGIMLQGMSGEINEEQRDQLGRVFRSGKHLLSLITDVIDIAKIESGKITPYPEDFDLHVLIDEAVGQVRQQAAAKGLAIEEHLPEHTVVMHSDRKRLLQCLLNYLSNAVKFTEKGVISISANEVDDGQVEIAVKDTGIGIKQEDIPLLFGSFVRLDSHLKTSTTGTGLGLYLTKKLATEVLGGMVDMDSRVGEGSIFRLRVPLHLTVKSGEQ
ncbi:MAG: PAS domain S-box protein [Proteobacteria bacterium]|nr:PAS domain S-box protein [Pseudomonadota bacterium]